MRERAALGGIVGMSLRFFDPVARLRAIYWADTRQSGVLEQPVLGSLSDGVGVFECDDRRRGSNDPAGFALRLESFDGRRNDANVSAELEDQVVDVRRRHGAEGGQLCCRLLLVEDVEWPIADGAAL